MKIAKDLSAKPVVRKPRVMAGSEVREQWADVLNAVAFQGESVAITRHGKVLARLVPNGAEGIAA